MRNNKMKGFTLVELLVVIAILAILATVSVVGYTSFIESATVSNDENIAAQLNNFLVAMKADHTGKYYGEEINENNVREVTEYILKDCGLDELVAQSAKYGYGFYYDLQEGKYVVLNEEESGVKVAGYKALLGFFGVEATGESEYEIKLENCFTPGNRYFYVGTPHESTPLAEIINSFYSFTSTSDYTTLKTKVDGTGIQKLITFVTNSVVVTDDCNYRLGSNPTNVIFVNGVQSIGTTTKQWNGTAWETITVDNMATITGTLTIPNTVKYLAGNSLNVGSAATIVFNKAAAELGNMAFQHFTDATIKTNDGTYHSGTCTCGNADHTDRDVIVSDADATVDVLLNFYNPANEFDVVVEESGEKQVFNTQESDGTKFAYVSWDLESFDASSANRVGSLYPELPSSTLENEFAWSISDNNLATINPSTGVVTFTGVQPTAENCTFTVTGTVNGVSSSLNIKVVAIYGATVTIADKAVNESSKHTLVFNNEDEEGQNGSYTVAISNVAITFTTTEVIPNKTLSITATNSKVSLSGTNLVVASGVSGTTTDSISISYGSYEVISGKTVTLFDADNLPFAIKYGNIKYVGNSNTLSASDFFVSKDDEWTIPSNVTLMVYEGASDTDLLDTNRATISTTTTDSFYVSDDSVEGFNTAFQFTGTRTSGPAYLCLVIDGVIVSPDMPVTVVNGYNVRSATETSVDWKSGTQSYVLLNDIAMWSSMAETNYIKIGSSQTLWGNLFELNIKNGYNKANAASYGIIGLWGTIRDTKIVGDTYTSFGVSVNSAYGASAIDAKNNAAQLINSYISGCRSPLRLDSSITVENCVFFGGRYSNIDIVGAFTLTLNGTNYTINQGYGNSAGVGIAAWFNDSTKTIVNNGTLKQYNFFDGSAKSLLPSINYFIVEVDIPDLFDQIMNDSAYDHMKFYLSTDTTKSNPFVHAGFVCLDYGATGTIAMSGIDDYVSGEKTITLCNSTTWWLFEKAGTHGISNRNMPNKVWGANPTTYDEMFTESQNETYMEAFEPGNYNLTWK